MAERLADVTVGPLGGRVAVIRRVGYRVGALGLSGAVFGVVEVKAVADVAEQTRRRLLLMLGDANKTGKTRLSCEDSVSRGSIIFILFESPQLFL